MSSAANLTVSTMYRGSTKAFPKVENATLVVPTRLPLLPLLSSNCSSYWALGCRPWVEGLHVHLLLQLLPAALRVAESVPWCRWGNRNTDSNLPKDTQWVTDLGFGPRPIRLERSCSCPTIFLDYWIIIFIDRCNSHSSPWLLKNSSFLPSISNAYFKGQKNNKEIVTMVNHFLSSSLYLSTFPKFSTMNMLCFCNRHK